MDEIELGNQETRKNLTRPERGDRRAERRSKSRPRARIGYLLLVVSYWWSLVGGSRSPNGIVPLLSGLIRRLPSLLAASQSWSFVLPGLSGLRFPRSAFVSAPPVHVAHPSRSIPLSNLRSSPSLRSPLSAVPLSQRPSRPCRSSQSLHSGLRPPISHLRSPISISPLSGLRFPLSGLQRPSHLPSPVSGFLSALAPLSPVSGLRFPLSKHFFLQISEVLYSNERPVFSRRAHNIMFPRLPCACLPDRRDDQGRQLARSGRRK